MGYQYITLLQMITGTLQNWTWNDEETYKKKVWETIPTSVLVSNGDYSVIRSLMAHKK